MADLEVKKGTRKTLKVGYFNGTISFRLSSNVAYHNARAPGLNEAEWER